MLKFYESTFVEAEVKKYSDEDWSDTDYIHYPYTLRGDTLEEYLEAVCSHTSWATPDNTAWEVDEEGGYICVFVYCVDDPYSGLCPAGVRQIEQQKKGLRDDLLEVEYTVRPTCVQEVGCADLSSLTKGEE